MNVGFGWNNWGWNNWYGNGWYGNGWGNYGFSNYGNNYNNSTYSSQAEEFVSYSNTVNRNYSSRNSSQNRTSTNKHKYFDNRRSSFTITRQEPALLLPEEGITKSILQYPYEEQIQTLVDRQTQIVPRNDNYTPSRSSRSSSIARSSSGEEAQERRKLKVEAEDKFILTYKKRKKYKLYQNEKISVLLFTGLTFVVTQSQEISDAMLLARQSQWYRSI
jgi:hypothetical protein